MSTATLPDNRLAARWFHALSDETRLEIVRLLSHGERCVCELQDVLGAAQSRLSFHLKTLKDAGLVTDRREGSAETGNFGAASAGTGVAGCAMASCSGGGGRTGSGGGASSSLEGASGT